MSRFVKNRFYFFKYQIYQICYLLLLNNQPGCMENKIFNISYSFGIFSSFYKAQTCHIRSLYGDSTNYKNYLNTFCSCYSRVISLNDMEMHISHEKNGLWFCPNKLLQVYFFKKQISELIFLHTLQKTWPTNAPIFPNIINKNISLIVVYTEIKQNCKDNKLILLRLT